MTIQPFDAELQQEADKYLQKINEKKGGAENQRQVGQRRRRLREALYKISSVSSGKKSFTTEESSFKEAAISAIVESANITNSIGSDLEKYGSPPGGDLVDDTEYDDEEDDSENEITGYILKPKTATIFGTKDGFADWMKNVYLAGRPMLADMIKYNYWHNKNGIKFGKERSSNAKRKAHKWVSMQLRKRISERGIRPNSVVFSANSTILNYDSGSHTLNRGRE